MIRCYDLVEEGMEEMAEHHEKEKQSIGFQKTFILWVWWVFIEQSVVFRCDAMLCCWFAVGLIEEELVEKGREKMAEHHERRKAKHRVLKNIQG